MKASRRASLNTLGLTGAAIERTGFEAEIRPKYEREGNPYHSTARLCDDGGIDPAHTLDVLALAIAARVSAPIPETRVGVFRM